MQINPKIFKAYDIRGRYPEEINEAAAEHIAVGISRSFFKKGRVVVAHDARLSSPALYRAVLRGVKSKMLNVKCIEVGPATTPMFYYLVNHFKASGGIMITASHNPSEYNGLKAVGQRAEPISGKDILKILNLD